eukprot:TRINITY_DN5375_c0_g1_i1.p1 TRINITY_DN5375_c0_g1~~TRINITY_DN5375_c0_g1_i1.p1  ORF type:complete len:433 (+),score=61.89 TRINITY_DN5375_c0_g1_i1:58-1356(+)
MGCTLFVGSAADQHGQKEITCLGRMEPNDTEREIAELRAYLASNSGADSKSKTEDSTTQREIEYLKAQLAAKSEARSQSRADSLTATQREIDELKAQLAAKSEAKSKSRADSLTAAQREIEDLKAQLAAKSETRSQSRSSSLTDAEREIATLREELAKKSTTKTAEEVEVESLRRKIAAMDCSIRNMSASQSGMSNQELREKLHRKNGIEICFVMDCTGSMGPWIDITKQKIGEIAEYCTDIHSGSKTFVRFAFIGYRDHEDAQRIVKLNQGFCESVAELKAFLGPITPYGGGDTPEDVAGAFQEVVQLPWNSTTRLVIHIADAPCHGTQYHSCDDHHPNGDPHGLNPETLLAQMGKLKIDYYFGRINPCTDQMISIFKGVQMGTNFEQFELGSDVSKFVPGVLQSVTRSRSISVAATGAQPFKSAARSWMY